MRDDPLAPLLAHFSVRAQSFFTGNLCGHAAFNESTGAGYLHLLRAGQVRLHDKTGHRARLSEPSLVFYSRPLTHSFDGDPVVGADLACASVEFENMAFNPVALALPDRFQCPLAELEGTDAVLQVLFEEAFAERPGRQEVLNRLFEVVLIGLVRASIGREESRAGFLKGLAHPQLAKALTAIHSHPERPWSLEVLAETSNMSRSTFAAAFRKHVGSTPGDYLTRWRVSIAQALLRRGTPLKHIAEKVGYGSHAGFLRAFKLVVGCTPSAWLQRPSPGDSG